MPQLRKYTLMRIVDERLDGRDRLKPNELPVQIYCFMEDPENQEEVTRIGQLKRLDSWILDEAEAGGIDWMRTGSSYWKALFKRAEAEAFIPGQDVPRLDWNGRPSGEDQVSQYWQRLARALPVGKKSEHRMWGFSLLAGRLQPRYSGHPKTHAHWLRILRYWIRTETKLLEAGCRRGIEDYPKEVQASLRLAIKLMIKGFDCVDNVRIAETRKPGEMRRFKRAKDSGCCGSMDRHVIIGQTQYIIGCNYGH